MAQLSLYKAIKAAVKQKEYTDTNYDENGRPIKNPDGSVSTHTYLQQRAETLHLM